MRPERLVAVAGTATGVGKTWATARLAAALVTGGVAVAVRKPVQSFAPADGATDADVLAAASGESPTAVCPAHRWYPLPLAPPIAAAALGRPRLALSDLVGELAWPPGCAVGLVETVGGPHSPLADDGDSAALVAALHPDRVVLVADAGLGAINAVRLSVAVLPDPVTVLLNRYDEADPTHVANADWLRTRCSLAVVTTVADLLAALSSA